MRKSVAQIMRKSVAHIMRKPVAKIMKKSVAQIIVGSIETTCTDRFLKIWKMLSLSTRDYHL